MSLERVKILVEIAKVATSVLIGLAILYLVQVPGTILNQTKTAEDIRRERSKLVIQAIEIEDDARRALAFSAIEIAYAEEEDRFFSLLSDLVSVQEQVALVSEVGNSPAPDGDGTGDGDGGSEPGPDNGSVGNTGGSTPSELPLGVRGCAQSVARIAALSSRLEELRQAAEEELHGFGDRVPGAGPIYVSLVRSAEAIQLQIEDERSRLAAICS